MDDQDSSKTHDLIPQAGILSGARRKIARPPDKKIIKSLFGLWTICYHYSMLKIKKKYNGFE